MSSSLASLAEPLRPWAEWIVALADWSGAQPRVTSTTRTHAKQQSLYDAYVAGRSRYPAARPYTSAHEYGYALDMVIDDRNARDAIASAWVSAGGVHGGEEDPIHFEFPNWKNLVQMEAPSASLPPSFGTQDSRLYALVDYLIAAVPGLRIIGIAQLASALYSLAGGDDNLIAWWVRNPVEFVRDVFAEWRALLALIY